MKVTDGEDCDRLLVLSDFWVLRPSGGGGGGGNRWCHRELTDDRVATTAVSAHHDINHSNNHHHHASSSRHRRVLGADNRRDSSTSDSKRCGSSSRASPVVITKDSSSCGEMPSHRDHSLDHVTTDFCRGSAERFSLRGARDALRRGVDNLMGRRTPLSRSKHQMNGGGAAVEIGDPVPVTSEALERTMERLGCVDLLSVEQVRQAHSSDSLMPCHRREESPGRLSVQLVDSARVTPDYVDSASVNVAPTSEDDWNKYFQSCFTDADHLLVPVSGALPSVVMTCVDDSSTSLNDVSRQTELDQILDEIVRDIDLLDQTLAADDDNSSQ